MELAKSGPSIGAVNYLNMRRILLLGRGGAGKSTLARQLGERLYIDVTELDKIFWSPSLSPLNKDDWVAKQKELSRRDAWIMDGDLGRFDVLPVRLQRSDTVILLDFPLMTCLIRALRRGRERMDFWIWLITWRRLEKPKLICAIREHAPRAKLIVLRNQRQVDAFVESIERLTSVS